MSLDSTTVELRKDGIVVDVPIDVAIDINDPTTVFVYAGYVRQSVPASEYTLTLNNEAENPKTWPTQFTITPKAALIKRADTLKISPEDLNRIYIQRTLPLTTDFEDTDAFIKRKIEEEFDEVHMKLQQLDWNDQLDAATLVRALLVPEGETGKVVPAIPARAHRVFAYDANGVPIPSNLTLAQIEAGVNIVQTPGYIVGSLTLEVPSVYPTVGAALLYLKDKYWASDATMTIRVTGKVIETGKYIAELNHFMGRNIKIMGATDPLVKTISATGIVLGGGDEVNGWPMSMPLTDISGIAIGDVISLGYGSTQNDDNDLKWGYYPHPNIGRGGSLNSTGVAVSIGLPYPPAVTNSGVGTAVFQIPGQPVGTNYLPMILVETGEIRAATAITGPNTFTTDTAFATDLTNLLYWLWVPQATGTLSSAGGTDDAVVVTGVGTDFLTRCSVGDLLFTKEGGIARITAVVNNTSIRVNQTKPITAGSKFGVYAVHQQHRGAFEITNLNPGSVTYLNKHRGSNTFATPRPNQVRGGTVKIYKNILKCTNVDGRGIAANADFGWIDKLAWVGPKTASSIGCSWEEGNPVDGIRYSSAHLNFGPNTCFTEWGEGFKNWQGSFYAPEIVIANHYGANAVYNYQGTAWLRNATVHGAASFGVFQAVGSSIYGTECYSIGHGSSGFYRIAGAFSGDGARSYGCNLGRYSLTGSSVHDVESWAICHKSVGSTWAFGGGGRASFNIILGNGNYGASFGNVQMQCNSMICGGNDADGMFGDSCDVDITNGGTTNNKNSGLQGSVTARFSITNGGAIGNHSYGISMLAASRCRADNVIATNNTPSDYHVSGWGCQLLVTNPRGPAPTFSQPRNHLIGGAIIIDTAVTTPAIKTTTIIGSGTFIFDCPSIAANNVQTTNIAVTGAAIRDQVEIQRPNFADTGISVTGIITAVDTLTVIFRNHTAAPIDPANGTYGYTVKRVA